MIIDVSVRFVKSCVFCPGTDAIFLYCDFITLKVKNTLTFCKVLCYNVTEAVMNMAIHSSDVSNMHVFWVNNMRLTDVNPIRCGWHQRNPGGYWGPSVPEVFNLHYVLSGKGKIICGGKTEHIEKQHLFLTRPGTVIKHQADKDEPWSYSWISFEGERAAELLSLCGFTEDVHSLYAPELYGIFDDIRRLDRDEGVPATYLCARLYNIFDRLLRANDPGRYDNPVAQYCIKAADYIAANYFSHITIDGISKDLGIDRRYFSRIFTKYTGVSPQKYLVTYRLERAKALLASGNYTVGEVASSVGYDDIFAFSKIFKKKYGVSPSQVKNKEEK